MSPPLTGCHLMIPALCHGSVFPEELKKDYQSFAQLEHAAILSHKAMDLFVRVARKRQNLSLTVIFSRHSKTTMSQITKIEATRCSALSYGLLDTASYRLIPFRSVAPTR